MPLTLIFSGEPFIYPNASAVAMSAAADKSHAAAVMSFLNIGLPTLIVLSLGIFHISTLLLPLIFFGLCLAILVVYHWISKLTA